MVLLALCLVPTPASAQTIPTDPVLALQETLSAPLGSRPTAITLEARKKILLARVARVTAPADRMRALVLGAWWDGNGPMLRHAPETAQRILTDRQGARAQLGAQMLEGVRALLDRGEPDRKLALVLLVGRAATTEVELLQRQQSPMGPGGMDPRSGHAPVFVGLRPDLLRLHEATTDGRLRRAILPVLARLQTPPKQIAGIIERGLLNKDLADRRAAVKVLEELLRPTRIRLREESIEEKVARLSALIPLAGKYATDLEVTVRRNCLLALGHAGTELFTELRHLMPGPDAPRPLPGDDPEELAAYKAERQELYDKIRPAVVALERGVPAAAKALGDEDPTACLAAHKAVENAATARLELARWAEWGMDTRPKTDLTAPRKAVSALARSLAHRDVRIRLAALYVLETLTRDAADAVEALVKALGDENAYVRWGAARALRNLAPLAARKAVPGLAGVLGDDNPDVRKTAVLALERYGPEGKAAVPALTRAFEKGDPALRVFLLRALGALGQEARPAAGVLVRALTDATPAIRRAAATALGRLGKLDPRDRKALIDALDDGDAEVRSAAAAALLGS